MKTGLESLDTGAPEITYSGNQGPKSPQEDQQKMAEFELQEYMEEFERVFPDMKDKRGTPDYMKELQDYFEGLASKQEEGVGSMAMKSGLIDEYRNYKMGQEEAGEQFMSPRDYYRSQEQDRMGVKDGGVMQLVKENENGSRPGYRGSSYGSPSRSSSQGPSTGQGRTDAQSQYGGGSYDSSKNVSGRTTTTSGKGGGSGYTTTPVIPPPKKPEPTKDNTIKTNKLTTPSMAVLSYLGNKLENTKFVANLNAKQREQYLENLKEEDNELYQATINDLAKLGYATRDVELYGPEDKYAGRDIEKFTNLGEDQAKSILNTVRDSSDGGVGTLYDDYLDEKMNRFNPDNRDGPPIILPPVTTIGGGADLDPEELGTDFTFNFGQPDRSLTEADKERISNIGGKSIFLADGGMARERAAFGGIMGDDGRRAYGLGSIFKKAVRGIKKVVKSPVGMAALTMLPMFGGQSLMGYVGSKLPTGTGMGGRFFDKLLRMKNPSGKGMVFDPFKVGIGALSALTYLKGKQDEDDEPSLDEYMKTASRGPSMDPRGIRDYIAANKGRVDPNQYAFLQPNFYAADGGRIDYANGGIGELRGALSKEMFGYDDDEDDVKKLAMGGSTGLPPVTMQLEGTDSMSFPDDESTGMPQATPTATLPNQMPRPRPMMDSRMMQQMMMASKMNPQMGGRMNSMMGNRMMAAMGGRMGFADGGADYSFGFKPGKEFQLNVNSMGKGTIKEIINSGELTSEDLKAAMDALRNRKAEGGMMDMGGLEKDYRNDGGFVPIGGQERADDVPARLSKNEFVFTADAVRNAGGGDIDKGAEIMENMMKNLENGGKVSQGSQGLDGAREMFATQQRLGEVL